MGWFDLRVPNAPQMNAQMGYGAALASMGNAFKELSDRYAASDKLKQEQEAKKAEIQQAAAQNAFNNSLNAAKFELDQNRFAHDQNRFSHDQKVANDKAAFEREKLNKEMAHKAAQLAATKDYYGYLKAASENKASGAASKSSGDGLITLPPEAVRYIDALPPGSWKSTKDGIKVSEQTWQWFNNLSPEELIQKSGVYIGQ